MRVLFVVLFFWPCFVQAQSLDQLQTRPEASGWEETSRYADVMAFVETVAAASERVHLTHFGYSYEGRKLPLLVVGDVADASPEAVRASGKTRVFVQGNIHAGEVEGKEAMQMLLRDVAQGAHATWFDDIVLLVAPIYNADGNERLSLFNRPRQHGPVGGMGQRPNAQDYDLNRDHMKLDTPEAFNLVGLMNAYDPHVLIDLHTTNGTYHAYHLTYSPPLNPNTAAGITELLRNDLLPTVTDRIFDQYGWHFYYYGNLPWRGSSAPRGWYTFDHRPRFNNNYVGLRNRVAILSEAFAYLTFEERIRATKAFVEEILTYVAEHGDTIEQRVAEADAEVLAGTELGVRFEHARSAEHVTILMGAVAEERNPYSGALMLRRQDVVTPEQMYEYGTFRPTETATVPAAYLVPADLDAVRLKLDAHGIVYGIIDEPETRRVQRFRIDSMQVAPRPFQQHQERTLFGAYEAATEQAITPGTLYVSTSQPLGRLAFYLLEPRSDDGLANWNVLDAALEDATHYPILRVPAQ